MKKNYILVLQLFIFAFGFGQTIATIDRLNITGPTLTDNTSSVSLVGLTRGAGINQSTTNSNFTSNFWTIGGDQATAEINNDYIEWSITANTTFDINLDEIDLRLQSSVNGPSNWQLFYSLDDFATAGIDASGIQTFTTFLPADFNLTNLGITSGASGTITFRLYAWGAAATNGYLRVSPKTAWSISTNVPSPGIRLIGSVSTTSTNSVQSDIIASTFPLLPVQENIDYTSYSATSGLNTINSVPIGAFTIRDGGINSPDTDTDGTTLSSIEFAITNSDNIAALAILDLTTFSIVSEVTTVSAITNFSGVNLTALDNLTRQFVILATFKSDVTDNEQIQLTVNTATTTATGSSIFAASNAGAAETSIAGDENRIEVTASQFQFNQQPTDSNMFEVMVPFPTIMAVDVNLNLDVDANITGIDVATISGSSSIVGETYDMVNGEATLDKVVFTNEETNRNLIATSASPSLSGASTSFNINGPLISIKEQNFDTATGWLYTSDTPYFGTIADWGDTVGYFGEIALTDASPIDNVLFNDQIFGENDLNDTGNPWATLTFADTDVSNFSNMRIEFDWQVVGYVNTVNRIQYQVFLDGVAQSVIIVFNGVNDINDAQGRVKIDIPDGTSTVGLQVGLRNNLANGYSGFDNFRLVSEFSGLIYTNADGWLNNIMPDATTGALDAIVVDGTYNVSGDVELDNLIINSGASMDIGFGESVTTNADVINNGDIELNSISNNYSSLIVGGIIENEVTYNRHVNQFANPESTTGANDLISAPVTNSNQTFLALRTANSDIPSGNIGGVPSFLFGPFDNNTNAYTNYTSADDASIIASGIGYRTASDTPIGSTFEFIGDVETGTKTVPISVGTGSVFNLIGNPYPSYINLSSFLATNNSEFDATNFGVYGYDGDASDGFTVWNQAYSDANPNAKITPGQGFLVASKSGGGTITYTPGMRTKGTSDDFIIGRSSENLAHLKLKLSKGEASYNTDFYFNDNASLGMDAGYDSGMFNEITPGFALYSHLVENNAGIDMAVQSVSYSDLDNVSIPLGINIAQGEQATISIFENNIPEGTTVVLEDNVNNTFTNLLESNYIFTPTNTLTETGRFYIHFSRGALSVDDNLLNGLEIYTNSYPKQIVIKGLLESNTILQLYDIQGRLVTKQILNTKDTKHSIDVSSLSNGVYVVQLQSNTGNRTQKVILK
jgi:hypothetical protein